MHLPMHLLALGISESIMESIMIPWTQAEETEETAAESGIEEVAPPQTSSSRCSGGSGAGSSSEA